MITTQHIKDTLAQLNEHVFSLYLYIDNARQENQADTPAWRIELKNALQSAPEAVIEADVKREWAATRQRVEAYFENFRPNGKTLVMFADAEQVHTHELPIALESASQFGKPLLTPLLWAIDEFERYLIVQVDTEKARFTSAYLGTASAEGDMQMEIDDYDFRQRTLMPVNINQDGGGAPASGGSNRDAYDSLIAAHRKRFYLDVVEHMRGLLDELGNPRVILSGDEKAAHELHDELPESFEVAGIAPASMNLSDGDVLEAVIDEALDYERDQEMELVNDVINMAKSGGRGATGHAAVVQALIEQRVEMLLLPYPPQDDDLANELKLKAFEHGATIELVHGDPADKLHAEGGVAAKLYYAYQTS
ncbi:MAG: VLRF1 family aeRF1-type release factor [Chloroflexota bacterium]